MPTPQEFTQLMRLLASVSHSLKGDATLIEEEISDGLKLVNGSETYNVPLTQEMVTAIMTVRGATITQLISEIKSLANQLP